MARTAEELRLDEFRERTMHWKWWGLYLAERAWGTVRSCPFVHAEALQRAGDPQRLRAPKVGETSRDLLGSANTFKQNVPPDSSTGGHAPIIPFPGYRNSIHSRFQPPALA
jgi:hypothetical protein